MIAGSVCEDFTSVHPHGHCYPGQDPHAKPGASFRRTRRRRQAGHRGSWPAHVFRRGHRPNWRACSACSLTPCALGILYTLNVVDELCVGDLALSLDVSEQR